MTGENFKDIYNQSISLFKKGEYDSALLKIDDAIPLTPDNFQVYFAKGMILKKLDRLDEASQNYGLSIKYCKDPSYQRKILEKKEEIDNILHQTDFSDLLLLDDENDSKIQQTNGPELNIDEIESEIQTQLDNEQYDDAIVNLDKFIGYLKSEEGYSDADLEEYYVAQSYASLKLNRYSESKEIISKVIAINPSNQDAININDEIEVRNKANQKIKKLSTSQKNFVEKFDYRFTSLIYILLGIFICLIFGYNLHPFSVVPLIILISLFVIIETTTKPIFHNKYGYVLLGIILIGIVIEMIYKQTLVKTGVDTNNLIFFPDIIGYTFGLGIILFIGYYLWVNLQEEFKSLIKIPLPASLRVKSMLYDLIIEIVLFFGIMSLLSLYFYIFIQGSLYIYEIPPARQNFLNSASIVAIVCIPVIYSLVMELSPKRATFGKEKYHGKVVRLDGTPATKKDIIYRCVSKIGTIFSFGLGFFFCFLTNNQQTMHDYVSGTCVINLEE